jgi:hypothetical protein
MCKIKGCNEKNQQRLGYCSRHYYQIRRYGKISERTIRDPNEITLKENHAEIILYDKKGEEVARALIDLEDVEKCRGYKWCLNGYGYVRTDVKLEKRGSLFLHNYIIGFKPVDHKNRNKLDNRKENLRKCTHQENMRNMSRHKDGSSLYKGVSWCKCMSKWEVYINSGGKRSRLGYFKDEKEAALAYNEAAKKYFGEFACLNEL